MYDVYAVICHHIIMDMDLYSSDEGNLRPRRSCRLSDQIKKCLTEDIKERKQHRMKRIHRFLKQMLKSEVRDSYITTVDRHVDKLLDNVKAKETKPAGKRGLGSSGGSSALRSRHKSQHAQINESKDKLDISTCDSILTHVSNPRMLLNPSTFSSLPLYYQYKLVKALPSCDQSVTEQGWIKPSSSSLSNEFFTKAVSEWMQSLKDGKLSQEVINKKKQDMERERSRLDPWKVKHFEPIWGKNKSYHSESVSELDRIPRTVIPAMTSQRLQPTLESEEDPKRDSLNQELVSKITSKDRIALNRKPRPLSRQLAFSRKSSSKPQSITLIVKNNRVSIKTKPLLEAVKPTSGVNLLSSQSAQNRLSSRLSSKSRSKRLRSSKQKGQTAPTETISVPCNSSHHRDLLSKAGQVSLQNSSVSLTTRSKTRASSGSKMSFESPENASSSLLFTALCSVSSERVKNDDPVTKEDITESEAVLDSPEKMPKKQDDKTKSRKSPRTPSSKLRISGPLNKNVEGVDEQRSLLICQKAIASSANNKLFVVTDHGKIQRSTEEDARLQEEPKESVECNEALSILSHAALLPRDVEIIPVGSSTSTTTPVSAVCLTKDQERTKQLQQQHPARNEDKSLSGITVQTLINGFIHEQLVNNNTGETKSSNVMNSFDANQNILQNILTQNRGMSKSSSESPVVSCLPYKLPLGITITPFQEHNQVPVITRSESHATETTPSVISTITSSHLSSHRLSPSKSGHHDNSGDSDISSGTDEVLTRLPSHITIIPLGSSEQDISQHMLYQTVEETSPPYNHSSQLTPDEGVGDEEGVMMLQENGFHGNEEQVEDERSRHECGLKALIPCSGCGAFCHSACVSMDAHLGSLCPNCIMRVNYNSAVN